MVTISLSFSLSFKEGIFLENSTYQGMLERRPVVIINACMKAAQYKTLIWKASTMAKQKEHPNPASYHKL